MKGEQSADLTSPGDASRLRGSDSPTVCSFIVDSCNDIVWVSDSAAERFGLSQTGKVSPATRAEIQRELREQLAEPDRFASRYLSDRDESSHSFRVEDPNQDEPRWFLTWGTPVTDGKHVGGTLVQLVDQAQIQDLQHREQSPDLAERTLEIGTWELDLDTGTVQWTEGMFRILGLPETYEPTIDDLTAFFEPEDRRQANECIQECRANGRPFDARFRIDTPDGKRRWVRFVGEKQGERIQGGLQDITDHMELEVECAVMRKTLRAELQSYLGLIVTRTTDAEATLRKLDENSTGERGQDTGNANEIDFSLMGGQENETIASRHAPTGTQQELEQPEETLQETLSEIETHAQTLEKLVTTADQIEACVGGDELISEIAMDDLARSICTNYQRVHPDATIETDVDEMALYTNPVMIETVLAELIESALHRAEGAPEIRVTVRDGAVIRVADTGGAMAEPDRKVLEQGLETARTNQGSVEAGIVNWLTGHLGGTITVEDNDPQGTVVEVELTESGQPDSYPGTD